jgi:hypothetical protein
MSTDTAAFPSPGVRDKHDTRRVKVAPLLAAGMCARDALTPAIWTVFSRQLQHPY